MCRYYIDGGDVIEIRSYQSGTNGVPSIYFSQPTVESITQSKPSSHMLVSVQASVESNHIHLDTERLETSMSLLGQSLPIPAYNMFCGAFATAFRSGTLYGIEP